jgi:hypothetical protein
MAAPKFTPVSPTDAPRSYGSPDHVPASWSPDRPGAIAGLQPRGARLGAPGPDQGFAVKIAQALRPRIQVQSGEHIDDVIHGCLGVALRRASLFSRAPVVHDLHIAFTVWGFYDDEPPADLLAMRTPMFEGLRHVAHHYVEARAVVDQVPEETLRLTPDEVTTRYRSGWRGLLGI